MREALGAAGIPHNDPPNHSLIWNGNFANDFLNGGLDWRWDSPFGASMGFERSGVGSPSTGCVRCDQAGSRGEAQI